MHVAMIGAARGSALGRALAVVLTALAALAGPVAPPAGAQDPDPELEALLEEVRAEVDLLRRRGDWEAAERELVDLLDEEPSDARTRVLLARLHADRAQYADARAELDQALGDLLGDGARGDDTLARATALELELAFRTGGREAGAELLDALDGRGLDPADDPRLAWGAARLALELGQRERGEAWLRAGTDADDAAWDALLARARCERALGWLERASQTLVQADRAARAAEGREPAVLVELGSLYFEADGEVDDARANARSPAEKYREALELDPRRGDALLGLFELHRYNWNRQSASADSFLRELFEERPDSIPGLLAGATAALELGALPRVREQLGRLGRLAPERRAVRTLRAALGRVEHREAPAEERLAELIAEDPADATPEREVGRVLLELYRFAEGLPYLERAVERDPTDHRAWTQLGRARANTGDVEGAREALAKADETAGGRRDAWRRNQSIVLRRIDEEFVEHEVGDLTFAWIPDGAEVLLAYWPEFYAEAARELAERYGYAPGPVRIEVFERHADFSVRSTGFEGFPALGVCFGPVVTAVSPLAELRGTFSWARTAFHEFTHVVHLGISNNRCPRWITEGLATWEERRRRDSWDRNMRRDLLDARANGEIFGLRDLNGAFRGPRILFGYFQGGLVCEMLIAEHGFPAMIRALEAFDRGDDLDRVAKNVFGLTPEEIDTRFSAFVDRELAGLHMEPRWRTRTIDLLRLSLDRTPPAGAAERAEWAERWVDVAFGSWQADRRVDAEEALRLVAGADLEPARAAALRGQMALQRQDRDAAEAHFRRFLELGGDDFRVRLALGDSAYRRGELDEAEAQMKAAEACFPGFADPALSAELALARLYEERGDEAAAVEAEERWLAFNAGVFPLRMEVAAWRAERGEHAHAAELYAEANEIDPFCRRLHLEWAASLEAAGRPGEAARELRVALVVPPELDLDQPPPLSDAERAALLGRVARLELDRGRPLPAREAAREALELDPDEPTARAVRDAVGG